MTKPVSDNPAIKRRKELFFTNESFTPCDSEKSRNCKLKIREILWSTAKKLCKAADECDRVDIGQIIAGMDTLLEARLKFYNAATLGNIDVQMEKTKQKGEDK